MVDERFTVTLERDLTCLQFNKRINMDPHCNGDNDIPR
jgi:hypothetical protein